MSCSHLTVDQGCGGSYLIRALSSPNSHRVPRPMPRYAEARSRERNSNGGGRAGRGLSHFVPHRGLGPNGSVSRSVRRMIVSTADACSAFLDSCARTAGLAAVVSPMPIRSSSATPCRPGVAVHLLSLRWLSSRSNGDLDVTRGNRNVSGQVSLLNATGDQVAKEGQPLRATLTPEQTTHVSPPFMAGYRAPAESRTRRRRASCARAIRDAERRCVVRSPSSVTGAGALCTVGPLVALSRRCGAPDAVLTTGGASVVSPTAGPCAPLTLSGQLRRGVPVLAPGDRETIRAGHRPTVLDALDGNVHRRPWLCCVGPGSNSRSRVDIALPEASQPRVLHGPLFVDTG